MSDSAPPPDPGDQRGQRRDYPDRPLRRSDLAASPTALFGAWLQAATEAESPDPTAMALATVSANGMPSVRTVLLKHFDAAGFCWYSDDRSHKGADLRANPTAALLFYWPPLSRQVRIRGAVTRLPGADADAYFHARPAMSRYAAAACVQSAPVANRAALERAVAELRAQTPEARLARPKEWTGYRLAPVEYEFWQGRAGRLHDRFRFRPVDAGNSWEVERLQP